MSKRKLEGIIPVLITPMKKDESIDLDGLKKLIDHLLVRGVHAICCNGSTGEFSSLTIGEQKRIIRATIEHVDGRVPVIVGTTHTSTRVAIELSRFAQALGADCVQVAPPYYGNMGQGSLFAHYESIANAIDIPVMIYNDPPISHNDVLPQTIAKLSKIDNIRYVKESSGNL